MKIVNGENKISLIAFDGDLVPGEIIQPEALGGAHFGLTSSEIDMHLNQQNHNQNVN